MSRPLGLVRPLALLIAVLSLTLLSIAPASASDKSLRSAVISLDKKAAKQTEAIDLPEDEKSPTFVADYTAGMEQLDAILVEYGAQISKQRGSTSAGRTARKLLLKTVDDGREFYRMTTKIVLDGVAGTEPTKSALDKYNRLAKRITRDARRAYELLKIKIDESAVPGTKKGKAAAR